VLVRKSACLKSSAPGLAADLPNIEQNRPASKPRNEFILPRTAIQLIIDYSAFVAVAYYGEVGLTINY